MTYWEDEPEQVPVDYTGDFGANSFANIFGRPPQACKPFAAPSDTNLKDPLRTVKVAVKSILVANLAMSAGQVAQEYRKMYGVPLLVDRYAFKNVDEMLSNFSDICSSYTDGAGNVTYMAITDERHEDLQHLIRRQASPPEATARRTGRLPCSNRVPHSAHSKPVDTPPPSDVRSRAPWLKDRVASTKAIGQFPCAPKANRIIFNDDGPKCKERCRAIANMVREIGERSPDGTEARCHIETLKNHYWEHTGLSIWGKIMSIPEYAEAWNKPELYEFWRIMTEPCNSEEEEERYYIVVPTDPLANCYKWLPDHVRYTIPDKKQSNQSMEDEIEFDNNLCPFAPLELEKTIDTRYTSLERNHTYQTESQRNTTMSMDRTDNRDFRPPFTSSVNSTYDGTTTNFFGSTAANQLPPDISNITAESCSEAHSARPKMFWGQIQDDEIMQNSNEESNLDYPFKKDNTFSTSFDRNDLSMSYREKVPSDNESVEKSPETIPTVPHSPTDGEWDPQLEQLNQQFDKWHPEKMIEQAPVMNERRSPRNLAPSGIRLINRHLDSHARDCRRRDPLKPCNTLPIDREDLKARQLADAPPEKSLLAPAEVVSTTSIISSETITTPTISISASTHTPSAPLNSKQLSPAEKMTELMDMLVKKVIQTMPLSDGRMSTLHGMLGFSHMLQSATKLKLGQMIDNLEYALDLEEDRNNLGSDA